MLLLLYRSTLPTRKTSSKQHTLHTHYKHLGASANFPTHTLRQMQCFTAPCAMHLEWAQSAPPCQAIMTYFMSSCSQRKVALMSNVAGGPVVLHNAIFYTSTNEYGICLAPERPCFGWVVESY